jgi:hypothetical protein
VTDYKDQPWTTATRALAEHEVFVRRNVGLESEVSSERPYIILVSLIYRVAGADGRPSSEEELVRLDRTEEAIADVMQAHHGARFGLAVTGGGTRDLFFFVRDCAADEEVERLIQSIAPQVDYQFEQLHDPQWQPYWDLAGA